MTAPITCTTWIAQLQSDDDRSRDLDWIRLATSEADAHQQLVELATAALVDKFGPSALDNTVTGRPGPDDGIDQAHLSLWCELTGAKYAVTEIAIPANPEE